MSRPWIVGIFTVLIVVARVDATTWYVRSEASRAGSGRTQAEAFASIQQAADVAQAGDTVLIGQGVYFESVRITAKGTAERPITFRADAMGKGRVIITGADPALRKGVARWTLEDAPLALYSTPWDRAMPARVLYSGTDLFPYKSMDGLRQFITAATNDYQLYGPSHGYAVDPVAKRLYVRLDQSGKYGPGDPAQHVMCVAPPTVAGLDRGELFGQVLKEDPSGPVTTTMPQFGLGILGVGNAHILIDGLTFETPGVMGVYTQGSDVTVRNCWFVGCLSGVGGTATYERQESYRYDRAANRIIIEHCDYTQFPAYEDGCQTIRQAIAAGRTDRPFWHRKDLAGGLPSDAFSYEVGIASLIGRDWIIRRNHIHDAFEGLNERAVTNSDNLRVYENVFERLLDNAVEMEDHATGMAIYRNVIRDVFVPITWQPLKGKPWPGPAYCYQNVIYNSEAHAALFAFRSPYVFKIGAVKAREEYGKEYVPEVAEPGLLFFNNTIFWERGCLFWDAVWGCNPDKVKLVNNILVTQLNFPPNWTKRCSYLTFENNLCVLPTRPEWAGQVVEGGQPLGLKDPVKREFEPVGGDRIIGKGKAVPGTAFRFRDIGAVQQGDAWYPLTDVGPGTNGVPGLSVQGES